MADIEGYQKYVQDGTDPYAVNPFAEGAKDPASMETPFAEQLPFRFTQFAINPSTQATAGQTGRSAVARSPFTSGGMASELQGIQSQIRAMGNVAEPGAAPVAPSMPQEDSGITRSLAGGAVDSNIGFKFGMPTKTYEVPESIMEGYKDNPLARAIDYEYGLASRQGGYGQRVGEPFDKSKYEGQPTVSIEGYDLEQILGADKWNGILNAKSVGEGEQKALYNLGLLPTSFNPQLNKTKNLESLARKSMTGAPQGVDLRAFASTLGPSFSGNFDDLSNDQQEELLKLYNENRPEWSPDWAKTQLQSGGESGLRGALQKIAPSVILGGALATIGGAAGAAVAPAGIAAGGAAGAGTAAGEAAAASGIAGSLGMSAGVSSTAVNMAAGLIASKGAAMASQELGLPMDNPIMQAAMAVAGGAAAGYLGGGATPGGVEGVPIIGEGPVGGMSVLPENYYQSAGAPVLGGDELGGMSTIPENYYEGITPKGVISVPASPGISSGFKEQALKYGQQGLQAAGTDTSTNSSAGVGVSPEYNAELAQYEQDLADYEKQKAEFEKFQELQGNYDTKMSEYMANREKYTGLLSLKSKQAGITSDIRGGIASNPFYDPEENYLGIQSQFV